MSIKNQTAALMLHMMHTPDLLGFSSVTFAIIVHLSASFWRHTHFLVPGPAYFVQNIEDFTFMAFIVWMWTFHYNGAWENDLKCKYLFLLLLIDNFFATHVMCWLLLKIRFHAYEKHNNQTDSVNISIWFIVSE